MDELTVLALRAKAGDRSALQRFVAVTRPDVVRLCSYLGRPCDPEDLTQETFERALGSLHRFRGDGPARGWLLSIARRVCVDATRRRGRQRRLAERVGGQATEHHVDGSWVEVTDILGLLDDDRREAFVLTQFVGLSYEETASVLDIPIGTVRSRVARARVQLIENSGIDRSTRSA